MLEYLKNYYVFMLVLMVFSFLVPKEEYKAYIQFFIGIFVVVLLLKPVLEFLTMENPRVVYDVFESLNEQIESLDLEWKMESGEDIYGHFFSEGETE